MASTKAVSVLANAVTLTAGAGDTTSGVIVLDDGYGAGLHIQLKNGATGPTIPAQVQMQVSPNNTVFYNFGGPLKGGTSNNGVSSWGGIEIPIGVEYLRIVSGSNTGQNVTLNAAVSEVTAV